MLPTLIKIKGVHPGVILKRALEAEDLKASELAGSIDEHKQTISAILNKRRAINPQLSIKLGEKFNVEDDYFMILQASYDVKKISDSQISRSPDLSNIRNIVFWDTDINTIDWQKSKIHVIQRILERGNQEEIREIISFYGKEEVMRQVTKIHKTRLPSFEENIKKFNLI